MIAKKKRKIHEVNAGSMADIAFLLLIFFLVATTIEIDEGIRKDMPFKIEDSPPFIFHQRNVFEVAINAKDELFVENERIPHEQLEEEVRHYFTANIQEETDVHAPSFRTISPQVCAAEIRRLEENLESSPRDKYLKKELQHWNTKMEICTQMPNTNYREIHKMAVIQLQIQAHTSFKAYILVLNTMRRVINELRGEICSKVWKRDYFTLDNNSPEDAKILSNLKLMIPERIIEKPIQR